MNIKGREKMECLNITISAKLVSFVLKLRNIMDEEFLI